MQDDILLFNSSYARVSISKQNQTATLIWKRQANKDEFWEACYYLMQYISMGNIRYCIFEHPKNISIPKEHKLWLHYLALPDAKTAGLKKIATLNSEPKIAEKAELFFDRLLGREIIPHRIFGKRAPLESWLYRSA